MGQKTSRNTPSEGYKHNSSRAIPFSSTYPTSSVSTENFYTYCKPIFKFGKIIGLIPFDCSLSDDNEIIKKGKMLSSMLGTTFVVLLWCDAMVGLQAISKTKFVNAAKYVAVPMMFIYYAIGAFLYWYHHHSAQKLFLCFQRWNQLKLKLDLSDKHLKRDVLLIAFIIMVSAVLENLVDHVRYAVPQVSGSIIYRLGYNPKNESFSKIYYVISADQWSKIVPYSPMISLYVFVSDKVTWYAWNMSDALALVFSRALYFKFKTLYIQGELMTSEQSRFSGEEYKRLWKHIAQDHFALWCLLKDIQEFLSPLIFITVVINTYALCLQIHVSLSDQANGTALDSVYAVWSVAHVWVRVWSMCIAGSRLHEWAHKVIELLRRCPSGAASVDVRRTEQYGNHHMIAWTGMDCFTVTNNLLMKIIGVVLTFEIIILQAAHQGSMCETHIDPHRHSF